LSYTNFAYRELQVARAIQVDEDVPVRIMVANAGSRAGDEVVIIHLRDVYSSVTTPVKRVVAFQRIHLLPGESRTPTLTVQADRLALYDVHMRRVIEPGKFEVYVGDQTASFEVIA
jgi:beta-glucosidase